MEGCCAFEPDPDNLYILINTTHEVKQDRRIPLGCVKFFCLEPDFFFIGKPR